MERKNVHIFDGKLKGKFSQTFSLKEKKTILSAYIPNNNIAKQTVVLILRDMQKKCSENYIPSNDIDASDILTAILKLPQTDDLKKVLEEQLVDINEGKCNSGISTRLYQVLVSFDDSHENTELTNKDDVYIQEEVNSSC